MDDHKVEAVHIQHVRNFDTLLLDSLKFLLLAEDADRTEGEVFAFSRASITYSLLLLEAAANICVEHLDLGGAVYNEIDRLPILAKFDFYLRTRFKGRFIDRGTHHVECLKELEALRDSLVHLKPQRVIWDGNPDDGMETTPVRTRSLQVRINPKFWTFEDAVKVSRGTHQFMNYFFKEKCKYRPKMVASLLFSHAEVPGDENHFYPHLHRSKKARILSIGVDLAYVKIA